ncbi:zinc finger protein 830-like [Mucor ambiguus]|uniref:Zinc finger protein 830 n=1 Tax=Mucor ambiguus TaxID=91626 RepID=A0A0C9M7X7_9FUNG|nr:zinc finger protein 830-like [Mucor ambiguus]
MPPKADVRRLLKKQQQERTKVAKITHPFAKYDQANRLVCVVCNSHVKSESVWQAHLGSQLHRDNIQKLKELKQQQQQQQQLKRRATSPSPPALSTQPSDSKRMRIDEEQNRQDIELSQDESDQEQEDEEMGLPADFFDKQEDTGEEEDIPKEVEEAPAANDKKDSKSLPSGFFDDPEEEARVQGTLAPEDQAKADLEKDAEMFNEAMMDVTEESKQVQEEDDEAFWEERHLDMTREQAIFDSRVEKLKQLRQTGQTRMAIDEQHVAEEYDDDDNDIKTGLKSSVRQVLKSKPTKQVASMFDDEDSDDDDDDDEEDWRAQQL